MKINLGALSTYILLGLTPLHGLGQSNIQTSTQVERSPSDLEQRLNQLSTAISVAQQRLADSQAEILELKKEVLELHAQLAGTSQGGRETLADESSSVVAATPTSNATIEEREQALEAAVQLHDQIKVESASKYPVRLTGLILFNGFLNKGLPDNIDLPELALRSTSAAGNGSLGGSFRQTILGIEGNGPRIAGAHTSASVDLDFFSGVSYSDYGTSAGIVRMRTASINFDWSRDSLSVGMTPPLISPLSPSSYATVAEPALAGAGNLWTWAPQLRYAHRIALQRGNQLQAEFGLWDSAAAGYSSNLLFRTASPGEQSSQPAYEGRFSYISPTERGLQIGGGGYYSRQAYSGYGGYSRTLHLDSWAATFDFRVPLLKYFELSGEGYRGRALGGLGGGVYKDILAGTSLATGATVLHGLNAIGGWGQFKTHLGSSLESNLSIGLDDGFARDFHAVVLPSTASATQLRARNKTMIANLIFKPKTYIILSPEYRRIWTWPITGSANTVDVYTVAIGYQF